MDTKTANLINDKISFSRVEKVRKDSHRLFFMKKIIKKIYSATFKTQKIIIYEESGDGGPLVLFDLGDGICISIFDSSRFNCDENEIVSYGDKVNDASTYFLGKRLIEGKQKTKLGKVKINFDLIDVNNSFDTRIHSVSFDQKGELSEIDVHFVGHGDKDKDIYIDPYGGYSNILIASGANFDYNLIPKNSFENGEEYQFLEDWYGKDIYSNKIEINEIVNVFLNKI